MPPGREGGMQSPYQQYVLPLQSHPRPHTVHTESSIFGQPQPNNSRAPASAPQTHLAGLGILPEAADRRLSRDDTAADVSELLSHVRPSPWAKRESQIAPEDLSVALNEEQASLASLLLPPQRPDGPLRLSTAFSSSSADTNASSTSWRSATLGRRFSKTCQNKVAGLKDLKENAKQNLGRIRRSSTPQPVETRPQTAQQTHGCQVPGSPSKRTGKQLDADRPTKQRHFLKQADRKDTPAPATLGLARPGSRNAAPPNLSSMMGGSQARMAAAALRVSPNSHHQRATEEQEDLNARRSQLGSSQPSAADSGADLSVTLSSNVLFKDEDGDTIMWEEGEPELEEDEEDEEEEEPLIVKDPLKLLPREISLQIFELLDAPDIAKAETICKAWHAMANQTSVWRAAFLRKYQREVYTNPAPIQVGGMGCGRPNRPNQEWQKMFKARKELDAQWKKGANGAGKAIYLSGHTDSVYCVQFDEEKIITGSRDRTIRVWDINNFTCQRVIGGPNVKPVLGPKVLRTVDYPDFHLATASVNGSPYGDAVYHVPSQWHDASILCLQYDEKILVTGSSDSDLLVWDINTYEPIKRLQRHTGGVLDVALDAKHIVSCSKDSRIIVWDRNTYEAKGELTGHRGPVNAVQLRGKYLVSASGDGIARLWDLHQMKLIKEFSAKERGLAAVEFSEDMKYVLAGGNDTITYKFETETGKEVKQFTGHSQLVRSLWLDSQNNRVVSGSYDLDLRVYDFESGEEVWRAEEWTTSWMLAAKSDYRRIVATSQDGRILIIDFGLQKRVNVDDGQPIPNVDLLRGLEHTNAIIWRDPWEHDRSKHATPNTS